MADEPIPAPPAPAPNPAESYAKLLAKFNNDAGELALKLFGENFELREKNRELGLKLPKDGSLVLTADEAKQFNTVKTFLDETKLTVVEIKTNLDRLPELEKSNKELAQMDNLREVATIGGYKVPVLKKLMADHPDASFEFKMEADEKDKTKQHKVAYIKSGDKESPFTEFAKENFSDFLIALKAEQEPQQIQNGNGGDPPPSGPPTDEAAGNAAMAAQARSTHSHF